MLSGNAIAQCSSVDATSSCDNANGGFRRNCGVNGFVAYQWNNFDDDGPVNIYGFYVQSGITLRSNEPSLQPLHGKNRGALVGVFLRIQVGTILNLKP